MTRCVLYLGSLFLVLPFARAEVSSPVTPETDDASRGFEFTLTPRIIAGFIGKIADETSKRYGFDADQTYQTRELFRRHFMAWLSENQDRIQPLMTQYLEQFLADTPPSATEVAEWARKFRPLVNDFTDTLLATSDKMEAYMTDEQLDQLEAERAVVDLLRTRMDNQMQNWIGGGWNPPVDHPSGQHFAKEQAQKQKELEVASEAVRRKVLEEIYHDRPNELQNRLDEIRHQKSADQTPESTTKDPWEEYVRAFIQKYELNEDQANKCHTILRGMQKQRDAYLIREDAHILDIENRLVKAAEGPQRDQLVAEYERYARPLITQYTRLKEKLNKIPTREQRGKARAKEASDKK